MARFRIAVEGEAADVRDGVLDVNGERAQVRVGGEEAAGFNDTPLPLVAVEIESDQRSDLHDRLDLREIRLGLGRLELLQRRLFRGEGAKGIFVSCVGRGPEGVLQGQRVVVGGSEFDGAVAPGAAAVCGVVADADSDADDALVVGHFLGERTVVSDGLVGIDVVETILDEVRPLHAGKHESLLAVELLLHRTEQGIVPLRGGFGGSAICNCNSVDHDCRPEGRSQKR